MLSRTFLTLLPYLAGFGAAAPTAIHGPPPPLPAHQLSARDDANTYNSSLPNITIFATGGTIAGSAASNTQTTGYQAGVLGVDRHARGAAQPDAAGAGRARRPALPGRRGDARHRHARGVGPVPGPDGTVRSEKSVVVVGAMRPATAVAADGPMNLLEAVLLAASPSARGRGAMVVLNDRIGSAFYVTKTHANALDTFAAREQGYLGFFIDAGPIFYYAPALPLGRAHFDVLSLRTLPQVGVLFGHQDLTPALARAAVDAGARGLVLAGMGAGSWTPAGSTVLAELARDRRTQVVASSRAMGGFVRRAGTGNVYGAQNLNPQKARIMLQLALGVGYSSEQLATLFAFGS
ncbi:hypothetical protein GGTG_11613 [Gaeumannomyces tritici R3-111a-1]|uniref:asparaginase n=1 Tax=Gaeumannomyces tritici (strain R3-111a-1) TaxID=644352 RepID=J3PDP0_GAET3|nr:hypothetical protein GGTG_11613 [Gaeumannomyces tritici R3-111a-1]EJT70590.1 hypothetical protein GGTG_11613 [Gaeumannomyces tritici R3-111a-1]